MFLFVPAPARVLATGLIGGLNPPELFCCIASHFCVNVQIHVKSARLAARGARNRLIDVCHGSVGWPGLKQGLA